MSKVALIILAHGGDDFWKNQLFSSLSPLIKKLPSKIVFSDEFDRLSMSVDEFNEFDKIFVFPLFVSQSKFIEKAKKILEGKEKVIFYDKKFPLCNKEVAEILIERVKEKSKNSKNPEREEVVIVAHGAIEDRENKALIEKMNELAKFLKSKGFKKVEIATLRDDSPEEIREKAIEDFKRKARKASIVLPLFVARGETFKKVEDILGEERYKLALPLMPSEKIIKLIDDEVRKVRRKTG